MRLRSTVPTFAWCMVALAAGVAAAVPLWCSRFLPFQDAPQHLAAISMLAERGTAATVSRPFFEVSFANAQYTGFYVPAMLLARFVGADAAIRILLTVVAL